MPNTTNEKVLEYNCNICNMKFIYKTARHQLTDEHLKQLEFHVQNREENNACFIPNIHVQSVI